MRCRDNCRAGLCVSMNEVMVKECICCMGG